MVLLSEGRFDGGMARGREGGRRKEALVCICRNLKNKLRHYTGMTLYVEGDAFGLGMFPSILCATLSYLPGAVPSPTHRRAGGTYVSRGELLYSRYCRVTYLVAGAPAMREGAAARGKMTCLVPAP